MDRELSVCFKYLIAYLQHDHYNRVNFSGFPDMSDNESNRQLQGMHCLYLLGQRLGVSHEELNDISNETSPDLTLGRG
jgi:hypothetical protein